MEDGSLNRINTFWYSAFSLISRGIMHEFWWRKFMWLHVNSISICHISKSWPTVEILFYIILSFTFIITVVSIYLHFWCDCKYFSEYCISPPHYSMSIFFKHVLYMLITTSLYVLHKTFSMFCAHMQHILVRVLPMPSKSETRLHKRYFYVMNMQQHYHMPCVLYMMCAVLYMICI